MKNTLQDKIKSFKEHTGLTDKFIEAIVNGGDYAHFSGEDGKDRYKAELSLPDLPNTPFIVLPATEPQLEENVFETSYEDFMNDLRTETLEKLTAPSTIEKFALLEQDAGLSYENTATLLSGSGKNLDRTLDALSEEHTVVQLYLLNEKSPLSSDEIIEKLLSAVDQAPFGGVEENISNVSLALFNEQFPNADEEIFYPEKGNLRSLYKTSDIAEKLNIIEEVQKKLDLLQEKTGWSNEQILRITIDAEVEEHRKIPAEERFVNPDELQLTASRYLADESTMELLDKASSRTGFSNDDIAQILEKSGVRVIEVLEQLATQATAINLERVGSTLEKPIIIEILQHKNTDLAVTAKILADQTDEQTTNNSVDVINKKITSFLDYVSSYEGFEETVKNGRS